jgi:soluble lytic murein transglycosylase-like protein
MLNNVNATIERLKTLPQPLLFREGQLHAQDPVMFPLIVQENTRRQQMEQAAMAQRMGQQAMPPVNQQALAQIAQTPQLPEEQGIGVLPARNLEHMADGGIAGYATVGNDGNAAPNPASGPAGQLAFNNEPVMRMADGGIAGYAVGGSPDYSPDIYRRYAIQKAREMGVNPTLADSIFRIESGYNPNAKSKTGPVGIGQLAAETAKGYGLNPNERMDGFKNIDASLAFLKDLQGKYNNDPQKIAVAYNQGEPFLNSHLKENNGELVPAKLNKPEANNYLKKLGAAVTGFIPSAQAKALPAANEWEDNTQQTAGLPSLRQNQNPGYTPEGVEAIGQRLDQAREELRNLKTPGFIQQRRDPNAAINYQNAQNLVSNLQRTYEEGMAAAHPELTKAAMIGNPANPQGGLRVLPAPAQYSQEVAKEAARPDIAAQMGVETPNYSATTEAEDASFAPTAANKQPPAPDMSSFKGTETAPSTDEIAKSVTGGKGRDWNDFLLNLGLGLMAGKSPYAFQNLGEAGLGALRAEQDKRKQDAAERLQEAQGRYYGAYATAIEHGAKEKNLQLEAEKMIQSTLDKNKLLSIDPEARAAAEAKLRKSIYQNLGIQPIMGGGMPQLGKADQALISKYLG